MKTATYNLIGGGKIAIEYDETAPCIVCGEPVIEASVGGTVVCPWCDVGICRYCNVQLPWHQIKDKAKKMIEEHMAWHKAHQPSPRIKEETRLN